MKKIKFSHHYNKLFNASVENGSHARLLLCMVVKLQDLPQVFLDYDTEDGRFELPKSGHYILLVFQGASGIFTTLRSAFPDRKIEYYKEAVGEGFEVCIEDKSSKQGDLKSHILPCPYYDMGEECEIMSPFINTKPNKSDVFQCPKHGYFEIAEDGDIITF